MAKLKEDSRKTKNEGKKDKSRYSDTLSERESTIRFTVDMKASLHRKLSLLAARQSRKKVDIVREALEQILKSIEE
jgi:uncharacterized protein YjgD (DUF1641 family)